MAARIGENRIAKRRNPDQEARLAPRRALRRTQCLGLGFSLGSTSIKIIVPALSTLPCSRGSEGWKGGESGTSTPSN